VAELKNKIVKTELVNWRELEWVQPKTVKKNSPDKMAKLKRSLRRNGFASPFYVWKRGDKTSILDGHHRERALKELVAEGLEIPDSLPAIVLDVKDEAEAKKMVLAFNSHYSEIQRAGFGEFIADLDFDEIKLEFEPFKLGFTYPQQSIEEDVPPPMPDEPVSKLGDIYDLGHHRVMCGDATEDIPLLMEGEKADMVFTDPPYGIESVSSTGQVKGAIKNAAAPVVYSEVIGDGSTVAARSFYEACLALGFEKYIIWGGNYFIDFLPFSPSWLIWNKRGQMNSNNFADGEMAWCSFKTRLRIYSVVWTGMIREGESGSRLHPTQKPVKLLCSIIADHINGSILDGFLGSGSTLIAAEQSDRKCYGLEIDPKYVDVIIQRWVNYTGQTRIKKNGVDIEWRADPQN